MCIFSMVYSDHDDIVFGGIIVLCLVVIVGFIANQMGMPAHAFFGPPGLVLVLYSGLVYVIGVYIGKRA